MKYIIYTLVISFYLFCINAFPQKPKYIEDEIIMSFNASQIDSNINSNILTLNDLKGSANKLKSAALRSYLINNGIKNISLPPFFKKIKDFNKSKPYSGKTLKNIDNLISVKLKFNIKKDINKNNYFKKM